MDFKKEDSLRLLLIAGFAVFAWEIIFSNYNNAAGLAVLDTGLESYYSFDSGDASDSIGNRHGIINSAVSSQGKIGQGMQFDGASNINLGNSNFGITNAFSAVFWVNFDTTAYSPGTSIIENGYMSRPFSIDVSANKLYFDVATISVTTRIYSSSTISTGEWVHIAVTYGDGYQRIYINGARAASTQNSGDIRIEGSSMYVGGMPDNFMSMLNGKIDELRIYSRALTEEEVESLYHIAEPAYCGDGACDAGESCTDCEEDCGACAPSCGDGSC
ncbi:TPA: LamG domain-containing protein, partial [Candidatus Woesearchaeota archaeon]|nr:LamG domain-containing protein [Candidatus Woesearchaeota archaeon]